MTDVTGVYELTHRVQQHLKTSTKFLRRLFEWAVFWDIEELLKNCVLVLIIKHLATHPWPKQQKISCWSKNKWPIWQRVSKLNLPSCASHETAHRCCGDQILRNLFERNQFCFWTVFRSWRSFKTKKNAFPSTLLAKPLRAQHFNWWDTKNLNSNFSVN